MERIIKKVSKETKKVTTQEIKKKINESGIHKFWRLFSVWLYGGVLALMPIIVTCMFKYSGESFMWLFFSDTDLIYVCVTMSIVLFSDIDSKITSLCFKSNRLAVLCFKSNRWLVLIGSLIYGGIKIADKLPYGFPYINMLFLVCVLALGLFSYNNISIAGGDVDQ